jgi:hypothetical protein
MVGASEDKYSNRNSVMNEGYNREAYNRASVTSEVYHSPGSQAADLGSRPDRSLAATHGALPEDELEQVENSSASGNSGRTSRPTSADKKYQDEVLLPLLVRRRAEARFKEATVVHESSLHQMKAEAQEIERRTVKQQNWMKSVDAQVLKVELTKATYQVRLDCARKRVATLGEDLSKAYENMAELLQKRLEVENLAAVNDALIWYLHFLGETDTENKEHFINNKEDLLHLKGHSQRLRDRCSYLDDILEQVRSTQCLASDIVKNGEELSHICEQLNQVWNLVPIEWKDSVVKSVQKGLSSPLSMHPVNAIQALQGASSHIGNAMKSYLRSVTEFVESQPSRDGNRRRIVSEMPPKSGKEEAVGKAKTWPGYLNAD